MNYFSATESFHPSIHPPIVASNEAHLRRSTVRLLVVVRVQWRNGSLEQPHLSCCSRACLCNVQMCACASAGHVPAAEHVVAGRARERPHRRAAGARGAAAARPADGAPRALLRLNQPLRAQEEPAPRARRARYSHSLLALVGVGCSLLVCCSFSCWSLLTLYEYELLATEVNFESSSCTPAIFCICIYVPQSCCDGESILFQRLLFDYGLCLATPKKPVPIVSALSISAISCSFVTF